MNWQPHYFSPSPPLEEVYTGDFSSSRFSSSSSCSAFSSCSDSTTEDGTMEYRAFACTYRGCTSRFKRKYTLKDHMNAHLGQKSFVCPVRTCGKSFTTSGNFARHRRTHPWLGKPRQCLVDGCKCEFPNDEKLQRHMLSHFDDTVTHRCDIGTCGSVFTTVGNLHRHIKKRHGDTPEAERLRLKPRPRRCSQPWKSAVKGKPLPLGRAVPAPPPFSVVMYQQPPFDDDLLDALTLLFDEDDFQFQR